jgi:hypothetical protein
MRWALGSEGGLKELAFQVHHAPGLIAAKKLRNEIPQ